jgi:hypothetical protein
MDRVVHRIWVGLDGRRSSLEALCGKRRNRVFDGDLVVVVVAIFGMEKLIGRAPPKRRHRHVEPCRTRGSD